MMVLSLTVLSGSAWSGPSLLPSPSATGFMAELMAEGVEEAPAAPGPAMEEAGPVCRGVRTTRRLRLEPLGGGTAAAAAGVEEEEEDLEHGETVRHG